MNTVDERVASQQSTAFFLPALLHLLASQEGIEDLHDLLALRRREFSHLAEPPLEAGVLSPAVALYLF